MVSMRYSWFIVLCWVGFLHAPEVYFSPCDGLRSKLVERIDHERESIKGALYLITDQQVIRALVRAHKRGVKIELILNKGDDGWSKIKQLKQTGITLFVYKGGQAAILHHKFFIFGRNVHGAKLVWTGSYNPTVKAHTSNYENVLIEEDSRVVTRFEHEFERLKKVTKPCKSLKGKEKKSWFSRFSLSSYGRWLS
jgi:phosphatidylserine/phosphatidylglycerophosphate/cardiolipin synthase-like enzyme